MISRSHSVTSRLQIVAALAVVAFVFPARVFGQLGATPAATPAAATPPQPGEQTGIEQEINAADLEKLRELAGGMEQLMAEGKYEEALTRAGQLATRANAILGDTTTV